MTEALTLVVAVAVFASRLYSDQTKLGRFALLSGNRYLMVHGPRRLCPRAWAKLWQMA